MKIIQINFFVRHIKKFRSRKDLLGQCIAGNCCEKIRYSLLSIVEWQEFLHYYWNTTSLKTSNFICLLLSSCFSENVDLKKGAFNLREQLKNLNMMCQISSVILYLNFETSSFISLFSSLVFWEWRVFLCVYACVCTHVPLFFSPGNGNVSDHIKQNDKKMLIRC